MAPKILRWTSQDFVCSIVVNPDGTVYIDCPRPLSISELFDVEYTLMTILCPKETENIGRLTAFKNRITPAPEHTQLPLD